MMIEILGIVRRVPILCPCESKVYEEERQRERRKQQQLRLERLKS